MNLIFFEPIIGVCGAQSHTAGPIPGQINSPNYPGNYPQTLGCWWFITSRPGTKILISFIAFDTETCCDKIKVYDYIPDITEPLRNEEQLLLAGGDTIPNDVISTGNTVSINFESDSSFERPGFNLSFVEVESGYTTTTVATTTEPSLCGPSSLIASPVAAKNLSSPGFPNDYPLSLSCWWNIEAPSGYLVELTFTAFNTETCCDKLLIYNSRDGTVTTSDLLYELKGPMKVGDDGPLVRVSLHNFMSMRFNSDSSFTRTGFHVMYKAIGENFSCKNFFKYFFWPK
ncbi:dorsal-ventral patterning tolloid-like protein 1 [Ciona intestinalis]